MDEQPPEVREDQERMQAALQAMNAGEIPAGSLVTAWVVVVEHMDPTGDKWFSVLQHHGATSWQSRGMLHEALFNVMGRGDDAESP